MRLSTKGRFAVTAMIDVGLRANAGPVSLSDIGEGTTIIVGIPGEKFRKDI